MKILSFPDKILKEKGPFELDHIATRINREESCNKIMVMADDTNIILLIIS